MSTRYRPRSNLRDNLVWIAVEGCFALFTLSLVHASCGQGGWGRGQNKGKSGSVGWFEMIMAILPHDTSHISQHYPQPLSPIFPLSSPPTLSPFWLTPSHKFFRPNPLSNTLNQKRTISQYTQSVKATHLLQFQIQFFQIFIFTVKTLKLNTIPTVTEFFRKKVDWQNSKVNICKNAKNFYKKRQKHFSGLKLNSFWVKTKIPLVYVFAEYIVSVRTG